MAEVSTITGVIDNDGADKSFLCSLFDLLTQGVVILLLCLLGSAGNTLSILTFWSKRHENPTSLLLLTLAITDTGVLVTHAIMITPPAFCSFKHLCPTFMNFGYPALTAYFWPVASTFHLCSTWLVTLVTLHRYVGVCHPHKFRSWMGIHQTKFQIWVIAVASFVYNLPRFFDDGVKLSPDGEKYINYQTKLGANTTFNYIYYIGLYYLIIYMIPFVALIFMTVCLLRALELKRLKKRLMTRVKRDENDMTLTLVIIVIVYMICQILNPIRRVLFLVFPSVTKACGNVLSFTTTLGIIVNSGINFVIFCIWSPRFRYQLSDRISCKNKVMDIPIPSFSGTANATQETNQSA